VPEEIADKIFDQVFEFANYGFNKAHAADYAVLSVQTAFMKAHYPEEYMAALLTVQIGAADKVAVFLEECRRLHIPILPPDINASDMKFSIEGAIGERRGIRFGLVAIKGAGEGALLPILDERAAKGPFASLEDLAKRVDLRKVGKRTIEALAQVGALDSLMPDCRQQIFEQSGTLVEFSAREHDDAERGQMNLFGGLAETENKIEFKPVKKPMTARELLIWEKELLGVYVSGRPIDRWRSDLRRLNSTEVLKLREDGAAYHEQQVKIAGEIVAMRKVFTKKQDAMAILMLEDWHPSASPIEVVLFPRTFAQVQAQVDSGDIPELREGEVFIITGKFDMSRGDPQIIGERVTQNFELMEAIRATNDTAPDSPAPVGHASPQEEPDWSLAPRVYDAPPEEGEGDHPPAITGTSSHTVAITHELPDDAPDWMRPETRNGHAPRWLVVTLTRSGDYEADVKLLKRLHRTIFNHRGSDHFLVRTVVDGMNHWFTFDDLTDCSEPLLEKLRALVPADQIQILDRAPAGVPTPEAVEPVNGGANGSLRRMR
jgi:DNA polymerase-3 subunit alpha